MKTLDKKQTEKRRRTTRRHRHSNTLSCRICNEKELLSHYQAMVPGREDSSQWKQANIVHCNRCGYTIVRECRSRNKDNRQRQRNTKPRQWNF